jgi:hypothetical protein
MHITPMKIIRLSLNKCTFCVGNTSTRLNLWFFDTQVRDTTRSEDLREGVGVRVGRKRGCRGRRL